MILDARAETGYRIGQEFMTKPRNGGDPQKYTLVGFRGEFVFLIVDGQKDGHNDRVISHMADPIVGRGKIDGKEIIETIRPPERLRGFSIAEEVVAKAPPFNDGLVQVDRKGLQPGGQYRLMGRHIDAGQIQVPGQFLHAEAERAALLFDLHNDKDGFLPLIGGRYSVSVLEINRGVLSLPTHLIVHDRQAPGVTIWRPSRVAS